MTSRRRSYNPVHILRTRNFVQSNKFDEESFLAKVHRTFSPGAKFTKHHFCSIFCFMNTQVCSVSIIGSFKQKYNEVLNDWNTFTNAGLVVRSPKGSPIIEPGIDFVRFQSDDPSFTDARIQQIALHRILGSDFVYATTPGGYVGRTACFEIGRILQANIPLYFSEQPADLPIGVPSDHVATAAARKNDLLQLPNYTSSKSFRYKSNSRG